MAAAAPQGVEFRSGPEAISLLELYSSEGCSSCPSAERWFGSLKNHPQLWKSFVPVVFHVTYWDYLGWKDPLGSEEFSRRQKAYSDFWGSGSVYTPGVMPPTAPLSTLEHDIPKSRLSPGELEIRAENRERYRLVFKPASSGGEWSAHIALLGFGIVSPVNVKAGENAGKELRHDFVVLGYQEKPMEKIRACSR